MERSSLSVLLHQDPASVALRQGLGGAALKSMSFLFHFQEYRFANSFLRILQDSRGYTVKLVDGVLVI